MQGRNVKGQNFTHNLTPVTLLHGRNWAGKTARLDALVLALGGTLPGVASKPNEIFDRVASGNPLEVRVDMDDGTILSRQWLRNGEGTVSKDETKACKTFNMPAVALDPSEFLGLSARNRVKFLFSRCKLPEEMTVVAMTNALTANVKNIKLEENTPASEEAIKEVAAEIYDHGDDEEATAQDWVESLVVLVGDKKKEAVSTVQRLEKTLQGLTQTALDAAPPPQDAERKLAAARKALEEAQAELARTEEAGRALAAQHKDTAALAATAVDTGATGQEIGRFETELDRGVFAKVPEPGKHPVQPKAPGDRPSDEAEQKALRDARLVQAGTSTDVALCKQKADTVAQELKDAKGATVCSKCGQSVVAIMQAVIAQLEDQSRVAARALANAEKRLVAFNKTVSSAESAVEAAQKKIKAYDAALSLLSTDYQNQVAEWEKRNTAWTKAQHELKVMRDRLAELKDSVSSNAKAQEAADKLPALQTKLNASREEYRQLADTALARRNYVSAADTDYKKLLAARAEEATRARTSQELDKSRAVSDVWKEAQKLVAALQLKLVAAAVEPLVARANDLCGGMLRAPLALRDGELVMDVPGTGWGHKTFSGTERLMAYCALSIALSDGAPIRLAIIDEIGRLDPEHQLELIAIVSGLVKDGKIDQAVIVSTMPLHQIALLAAIRSMGVLGRETILDIGRALDKVKAMPLMEGYQEIEVV